MFPDLYRTLYSRMIAHCIIELMEALFIVGYKFSRASYVLSLLRPVIFEELQLKVCSKSISSSKDKCNY